MKKYYWYFIGGLATVFIPVGVMFLIILIFAAALGGVLTSDNKSHITVLAENTSPNQKYIVTTFSSMGGGAAGWCSAKVSIRRSEQDFNQDESVFSSHCGTKISTDWENDGRLRISYSTDEEMIGMNQKGWNPDKTVKIIYKGK